MNCVHAIVRISADGHEENVATYRHVENANAKLVTLMDEQSRRVRMKADLDAATAACRAERDAIDCLESRADLDRLNELCARVETLEVDWLKQAGITTHTERDVIRNLEPGIRYEIWTLMLAD